jgi:hypothetical protein
MPNQKDMLKVLDAAATLLRVWIAPVDADGIATTEDGRADQLHELLVKLYDATGRALDIE